MDMRGRLQALAAFIPRQGHMVLTHRIMSGPHRRSRSEEKKKIFLLGLELQFLFCQAHSVAILLTAPVAAEHTART
jgi:hypothetical protein